jgi:hypothetical protein
VLLGFGLRAVANHSRVEEIGAVANPTETAAVLMIPSREPTEIIAELTAETVIFVPDEEVDAIAQTLAGECYDDKLTDKRLVAEVVVNRVSKGNFGEDVVGVVTARGQFCGYWDQSRPVSESDIRIAEETLRDWYEGGREPLSEYLFFHAGPNRENVFRTTY